MSKNWSIIILGATGNLAQKKLIPALCSLLKNKYDEFKFTFVGAAREKVKSEELIDRAKKSSENFDEEVWNRLKNISLYQSIDFNNYDEFEKLAEVIVNNEKKLGFEEQNRLFYLAVPADFFCLITKNLVKVGLLKNRSESNSVHRVVYEKPFGWDLESAEEINSCVSQLLTEDQIFRIDHYLTKALVHSIIVTRFSNLIFDSIWNGKYIDHIQLIFNEEVSIKGRGQFFDKYGALKDVVQNHMLQILSLITMKRPKSLNYEDISQSKCEVLKNIQFKDGLLGQYKNYLSEEGVKKSSKTETFAALKAFINIPEWNNVPIYLKTGKALKKKSTEIHLVLKNSNLELFKKLDFYSPNVITFRITPDAGLFLQLNVQKSPISEEIVPTSMDFCYSCVFGYDMPRSYEILLLNVIKGDKNISVNWDEIMYSWKLISQIKDLDLPIFEYEQGSNGPEEAKIFAKNNNFNWML